MASFESRKAILEHWAFPCDGPVEKEYSELTDKLGKIFNEIVEKNELPKSLDDFVKEFDESFRRDPLCYLRVFHDGRGFRRSVTSQSINIAVLVSHYSQVFLKDPGIQRELLRAALLHDVGMLFLPLDILQKQGKYTEKERVTMEAHPSIGYEKLRNWKDPPSVQLAALQHHEAWNGEGYPQGLAGGNIHLFSQIIGCCVQFSALVTERQYRNSMLGFLGMKQIISLSEKKFDPLIVKNLISAFGLYPPGSIVLLSDGSIARVLEPRIAAAMRPLVRVLIDSSGRDFRDDSGPILDLSTFKKIFIARPVNFQDILDGTENWTPN